MPSDSLRRQHLQPGEILCTHCTGQCCRYFTVPIDRPKERKDFDDLRWYLMHGAAVFMEDDTWYVLVHRVCENLQNDHRCGAYENRPKICRDYSTDECEFGRDWLYEVYFETTDQMDEYIEARFARPGDVDFRSRPPELLPVIPH